MRKNKNKNGKENNKTKIPPLLQREKVKLVDLFGDSIQKISFISKVLQKYESISQPLAKDRPKSYRQWPSLYSWSHLDTIHSSLFFLQWNTQLLKLTNTPKERGEKEKTKLLLVIYSEYSIHLTQLLCWKVYLLKLIIVSHSPCHKITLCTPSKHKIPVLSGLILGQKNISELEGKQGCPKLSKAPASLMYQVQPERDELEGSFQEVSEALVVRKTELRHYHCFDHSSKYSWLKDPPFRESPPSMILDFRIL